MGTFWMFVNCSTSTYISMELHLYGASQVYVGVELSHRVPCILPCAIGNIAVE